MMSACPVAVAKMRADDHVHAMRILSFLSFLTLSLLPLGAHAASSDWLRVEGGAIRIVTSGTPDASGHLQGALEIHLDAGWKTYWRDPGASGVPPTLEVTAQGTPILVNIGFPAPERFDDGYANWAGYDQSVALPLSMALPDGALPEQLQADIFLGICETICIPVQASLTLDPYNNADEPEHADLVSQAFAALPQPATPDFLARVIEIDGDTIVIAAKAPEGTQILDLFVAGPQTLTLDTPHKAESGSQTLFYLPMMASSATVGQELNYTLVTDAGAVSGRLHLP